jgi:hypothetical protein
MQQQAEAGIEMIAVFILSKRLSFHLLAFLYVLSLSVRNRPAFFISLLSLHIVATFSQTLH